jgi:hypothetical protein
MADCNDRKSVSAPHRRDGTSRHHDPEHRVHSNHAAVKYRKGPPEYRLWFRRPVVAARVCSGPAIMSLERQHPRRGTRLRTPAFHTQLRRPGSGREWLLWGNSEHSPISRLKAGRRRKRSLAGADHTLLQVSPVGTPAVIPARTNSAAPGKYDVGIRGLTTRTECRCRLLSRDCQDSPYWVSDCS